jgi:hypothetical protein
MRNTTKKETAKAGMLYHAMDADPMEMTDQTIRSLVGEWGETVISSRRFDAIRISLSVWLQFLQTQGFCQPRRVRLAFGLLWNSPMPGYAKKLQFDKISEPNTGFCIYLYLQEEKIQIS